MRKASESAFPGSGTWQNDSWLTTVSTEPSPSGTLMTASGDGGMLVGPNASGKSTFLSLLCGIVAPQSGTIEILGTDFTALSGVARDRFRAEHFGIIFQMFNLLPYGTAVDNIVLPLAFIYAYALQRSCMRWKGLFQALALIPGVSRSGATMSFGLFQGFTREAAARYSFLLSVPAVVLSGAFELRTLLRLSTPVALGQLAFMLLGFVDVVMVGHYSTQALAAATLANVWVFGTMMFATGILFGLDPLVSQANGAGDGARCGLSFQRGLALGAALSPLLALSWFFTEPALLLAGQTPELAQAAGQFAIVQIPSVPFLLGSVAIRSYLQGRGIVLPSMWVSILANLWNAGLAWLLIYGELGAPELGLVGAGIATSLTRILSFAVTALMVPSGTPLGTPSAPLSPSEAGLEPLSGAPPSANPETYATAKNLQFITVKATGVLANEKQLMSVSRPWTEGTN